MTTTIERPYRGRIAPTPTGWLHLGHAATFGIARERARQRDGILVYRTEDLDPDRCRPEYTKGAMEDLRWWGLDWDEGPDMGGPFAPYVQSEDLSPFKEALAQLVAKGCAYPSPHSRKEIAALNPRRSPVDGDVIFPELFRPQENPGGNINWEVNWRFRVPDSRNFSFMDGRTGKHSYQSGRDFGDFLVWRKAGIPSYELAVVVDDHRMEITEVVRGEDLLLSTARQLLLYAALGWDPPLWYHCPLVIDPATGRRMSKPHKSLGLRALRESGQEPGLPVAAYLQ